MSRAENLCFIPATSKCIKITMASAFETGPSVSDAKGKRAKLESHAEEQKIALPANLQFEGDSNASQKITTSLWEKKIQNHLITPILQTGFIMGINVAIGMKLRNFSTAAFQISGISSLLYFLELSILKDQRKKDDLVNVGIASIVSGGLMSAVCLRSYHTAPYFMATTMISGIFYHYAEKLYFNWDFELFRKSINRHLLVSSNSIFGSTNQNLEFYNFFFLENHFLKKELEKMQVERLYWKRLSKQVQ